MTSKLMANLRNDPWAGLDLADALPAVQAEPTSKPEAAGTTKVPRAKARAANSKLGPRRPATPAKAARTRRQAQAAGTVEQGSAPASAPRPAPTLTPMPATTEKLRAPQATPAKAARTRNAHQPVGLQAEANAAYVAAEAAFMAAPGAKAPRPRRQAQAQAAGTVEQGSAPASAPRPAPTLTPMPATTEKLSPFGVNTTLTLPRAMKRALDLARADDGIDNTRRVRAMIELWRDNTNVRRSIEKIARERALQVVTIDTRIAITMQRALLRDLNLARADDGIENTTRIRAVIELWQTNQRIRTMIDGLAAKHR
jgi:hypothetical protein